MDDDLVPARTEADAVADLVIGSHVHEIGFTEIATLPANYKVVNLEKYQEEPARHRANVALTDQNSFVSYLLLNKSLYEGPPVVYFSESGLAFRAQFDPLLWREDEANYALTPSEEWKRWMASNGKGMKQTEFATFIEDNLVDIVTPDGATMLEIASGLEAKKSVSFASGIRLSNGSTEFTFQQEVQGTTQKGKMQVPEMFSIAIAVFNRSRRVLIDAKLRYRISEQGALTLWYDLVRPHVVKTLAIDEMVMDVAKAIGQQVLMGDPGESAVQLLPE
jgi:uncharacterized protein YfdQ (DUF2303 family)